MKVIYYQSPNGNFGDDLNAVLWREVLHPACFDVDDAVLLGIGSIFRDDFLSEEATNLKRVFVLGSGPVPAPLPTRWPNASWSILAVRGPLTASLIGVPQAAVTDSAALIATTLSLLPKAGTRGEVAFMPHYNSVLHSRWPEICTKLGLTYIDAHWPVADVIEQIGRARLVITEAMHGAIVADTLRIPWIPVVCSPSILPFKWIDWTESLDLDYRPLVLPASSAWEALKNFKIRAIDGAKGVDGISDRDQDILNDFYCRFGGKSGGDLVPKPLISGGQAKTLRKLTAMFDRIFSERAAEALAAASKSQPYLSKDGIFRERVEQLQGAVATLQRALVGTMH
jgi:succinoglycan biosynthesis protein ExoV